MDKLEARFGFLVPRLTLSRAIAPGGEEKVPGDAHDPNSTVRTGGNCGYLAARNFERRAQQMTIPAKSWRRLPPPNVPEWCIQPPLPEK